MARVPRLRKKLETRVHGARVPAHGRVMTVDAPVEPMGALKYLNLGVATCAGALPLPKGEGWGEGLQTIESTAPLTPPLSPTGRGSRPSSRHATSYDRREEPMTIAARHADITTQDIV